jgi:hypothetical protein
VAFSFCAGGLFLCAGGLFITTDSNLPAPNLRQIRQQNAKFRNNAALAAELPRKITGLR